jgi:predicted N-acetyltransferase YhbS
MRPDEYPAVRDLVADAYREFAEHMETEHFQQMQINLSRLVDAAPPENLFVAELGRSLVGTVTYWAPGTSDFPQFPPAWALLRVLAVAPAFRGRGIGRRLSEVCLEMARRDGAAVIGLYTSELMTVARPMYERMGFRRQEAITHLGVTFWFYTLELDTEDAIGSR